MKTTTNPRQLRKVAVVTSLPRKGALAASHTMGCCRVLLLALVWNSLWGVSAPAQTASDTATATTGLTILLPDTHTLGHYLAGHSWTVDFDPMRQNLGSAYSPGFERRQLQGTVTTEGGTFEFVFTRELDQNIRLDFNNGQAVTFIATGLDTPYPKLSKETGLSTLDKILIETLVNDSPDAVLFGFIDGDFYRRVGYHYRLDDGRTPNYEGPYADVSFQTAKMTFLAEKEAREKLLLLDSTTKAFAGVRYKHGTTHDEVTYQYSHSTPNLMITRTDSGSPLLLIEVSKSTLLPTQADNFFQIP